MGVKLFLKKYNPLGEQDPDIATENWFTAGDNGTMEDNLDGLDTEEPGGFVKASRSYEGTYSFRVGSSSGMSGIPGKIMTIDDRIRLLPLTEYTISLRILVDAPFQFPVLYRLRMAYEGWNDGIWYNDKEWVLQKNTHLNRWYELRAKLITGSETLGKIYVEQYGVGISYQTIDDSFFVHVDSVVIRRGSNFATTNFESFVENEYRVKDTLDSKIDYQFRDWKKIGERFRKDASKTLSIIDEGSKFNVVEEPSSVKGEAFFKDIMHGRIETDGEINILEGLFRLMDIDQKNHVTLYKGQLAGRKSGWLEAIRDKEFCDFDWQEYNHKLTITSARESWLNNGETGLFVYDQFDQGNYINVTGKVTIEFGAGAGSGDCILGDISVDDAFNVAWNTDLETTLDDLVTALEAFKAASGKDKYTVVRSGTTVTITINDPAVESIDVTIEWVLCSNVAIAVNAPITITNETVMVMGDITELRPSIFVIPMIRKILRLSGYSLEIKGNVDSFLSTDEFRDLVIRWGKKGLEDLEISDFEYQSWRAIANNTFGPTLDIDEGTWDEFEFDGVEYDPENFIHGDNTFTKPAGQPVEVRVTIDGTGGDGTISGTKTYDYPANSPQDGTLEEITLFFYYDNGTVGSGTDPDGEELEDHMYWIEIHFGDTGVVKYLYDDDEPEWTSAGHVVQNINDDGNGCYTIAYLPSGVGPSENYTICPSKVNDDGDTYVRMRIGSDERGYLVDWNKQMMCNDIREFMEDFANTLNLFYITDEATKTVTMIDEDSFYGDLTNEEEWTNKIDRGEMKWQKLARFYARYLKFGYKNQTSDKKISDLNQGRNAITDESTAQERADLDFEGLEDSEIEFGGEIFDIGVRNSKKGNADLIKLKLIGASVMGEKNGMRMPCADLGDDEGELSLRMNIYGGLRDLENGDSFALTSYINTGFSAAIISDFIKITDKYPYTYFYGEPGDGLKNLSFGNFQRYDATKDLTEAPGLAWTNYKRVLLTIRHGRILVTYADLTDTEVRDREYGADIWIDENKFHLAKILSYDPHKFEMSKVELITVQYYLDDAESLKEGMQQW